MNKNKLKVICFDLDDTLWPCHEVVTRAEEIYLDWLKKRVEKVFSDISVDEFRVLRMEFYKKNKEYYHDLTALRRKHLSEVLAGEFERDLMIEEGIALFLEARNQVNPYVEVVSALSRLGQRYQLLSMTNGNADIEKTPLRGIFEHNFSSAELGASKPSASVFNALLSYGNWSPEELLHVGDNPENDIAGPQELGIPAVWINRDEKQWGLSKRPDMEIQDLLELCAVLQV